MMVKNLQSEDILTVGTMTWLILGYIWAMGYV